MQVTIGIKTIWVSAVGFTDDALLCAIREVAPEAWSGIRKVGGVAVRPRDPYRLPEWALDFESDLRAVLGEVN